MIQTLFVMGAFDRLPAPDKICKIMSDIKELVGFSYLVYHLEGDGPSENLGTVTIARRPQGGDGSYYMVIQQGDELKKIGEGDAFFLSKEIIGYIEREKLELFRDNEGYQEEEEERA